MEEKRWAWIRYAILAAEREGARALQRRLGPLGLSPAQAEALAVLAQFRPLTLRQLGRLLVCETGSPSRLVAGLVQEGLVRKTPDPEDVRRVRLDLTPAGEQAARAVREAEAGFYRDLQAVAEGGPGGFEELLRRWLAGTAAGEALKRRGLWPPDAGAGGSPAGGK